MLLQGGRKHSLEELTAKSFMKLPQQFQLAFPPPSLAKSMPLSNNIRCKSHIHLTQRRAMIKIDQQTSSIMQGKPGASSEQDSLIM
jgi:hypothetical protein